MRQAKTSRVKRTLAAVLSVFMLLPMLLIFGSFSSAADNNAAFEQELQQAREIYFNSVAPEAQDLVPVTLSDNNIIHRELMPFLEEDDPSEMREDFGTVRHPGPFAVNDTRLFNVELYDSSSLPDSYVKGRMIAQGSHTNVWVLDDADYHSITGTSHATSTNCNLQTLNTDRKIAQNLANAFDVTYERMTADFGPHAYTSFDRGSDGHINFLLYDIDGIGASGGGYVAGFHWALDLSSDTSGGRQMNNLDMLHIDCAEAWYALDAQDGNQDRLNLYNTLSHEFQHFLYNGTFGTSSPTWFNESLAELAGCYYTQKGMEVAGYSDRMRYLADNQEFNTMSWIGALQQYARVKAFSMQNYKRFPDYAKTIYTYIKGNLPYSGTDTQVGNALQAATGMGSGGTATLQQNWTLYWESLASDGGTLHYQSNPDMQMVKLHTNTWEQNNLWALRPASLGQSESVGGSGITNAVWIDGGNSYYALSTSGTGAFYIPTLTGTSTTLSVGAQNKDKIFKLTGTGAETTATPILNFSVNETNQTNVRYYVAIPNRVSANKSSGAAGADVYELKANGTNNQINTNGRPAYLFVSTYGTTVSNRAVTFSWTADATALVGTVTLAPTKPVIGNTVTATVTANGGPYTYAWYLDGALAPFSANSASVTIPDNAAYVGQTLTVKVTSPPLTGTLTGSATAIGKKTAAKPTPPVVIVSSVTSTSIELEVLPADTGLYEYSQGGVIWQDSPLFTNLLPDTNYNFYRRLKATTDTVASPASDPATAHTLALGAPTITSANTTTVVSGTGGTFQVTATGTPSAMTYSLTGAPAGVSINSTSGLITIGTGVAANTYTFTVTASNGVPSDATQNFTLVVNPNSAKNITNITSVTNLAIGATTVTADVANSVSSLNLAGNLSVSTGATWKLFSDAACTAEITSKTMTLAMGANTAYVKVTAEDGSVKVYTLTITRSTKIFPDGTVKILRSKQSDVFKGAIKAYGGALRFETTGKIAVDSKGWITFRFLGVGKTTVTAYDAITGAEIDSIEVCVTWSWWQWILVVLLFGWLYL